MVMATLVYWYYIMYSYIPLLVGHSQIDIQKYIRWKHAYVYHYKHSSTLTTISKFITFMRHMSLSKN